MSFDIYATHMYVLQSPPGSCDSRCLKKTFTTCSWGVDLLTRLVKSKWKNRVRCNKHGGVNEQVEMQWEQKNQQPLESRKEQLLHFLLRPCESFICFLFTQGWQVTRGPSSNSTWMLPRDDGRWTNTPHLLPSYPRLSFKPWVSLLFLRRALEAQSKVLKVTRGSVTMTVSCQSFHNCEAFLVLQWELCVLDHHQRTKEDERKLPQNGKIPIKNGAAQPKISFGN